MTTMGLRLRSSDFLRTNLVPGSGPSAKGQGFPTAGPVKSNGEYQLTIKAVEPRDDLQAPQIFLPPCFDRALDCLQVKCAFGVVDPTVRTTVKRAALGVTQDYTHRDKCPRTAGICKWGVYPITAARLGRFKQDHAGSVGLTQRRLSNSFQCFHAWSCAFLLASLASGASPARMKPWPAPS